MIGRWCCGDKTASGQDREMPCWLKGAFSWKCRVCCCNVAGRLNGGTRHLVRYQKGFLLLAHGHSKEQPELVMLSPLSHP